MIPDTLALGSSSFQQTTWLVSQVLVEQSSTGSSAVVAGAQLQWLMGEIAIFFV